MGQHVALGQDAGLLVQDGTQQVIGVDETFHQHVGLVFTNEGNSLGGSVSAGFAIYDTMKNCGCPVMTICNGMAASMAAFLLASGTKGMRYCMPHADVMIHQVMGGVQGQAADIEICAEQIKKKKHMMNQMLSEMTGQPVDKIRIDTDRDHYMNASEALAYGMVDHIGLP